MRAGDRWRAIRTCGAIKLERSSVTDAGMAHLQKIPKLEDLDLRRTGITAAGYKEVGKIAGLKRLRVVYNARFNDDCLRGDQGPEESGAARHAGLQPADGEGAGGAQGLSEAPQRAAVWAEHQRQGAVVFERGQGPARAVAGAVQRGVPARGLTHIKGMKNLHGIGLYGATGLNDAAVAKLAEMTKLQKLDLRQTPITSLALSYLKDMKGLKALDLSETANVGNEGLEHIKGLTNLEDLNLWSCKIDDAGLANLKGMTKLKRLNLDKCNITDED